MNILKQIQERTGLDFSSEEIVQFKTGLNARRVYFKLGNVNMAFLFVELKNPNLYRSYKDDFEDIVFISRYEKILIYKSEINHEEEFRLKQNRIGYIDDSGKVFLPLDIDMDGRDSVYENYKKPTRFTGLEGEFLVSFLLLKNYGLLEATQSEIGKLIGKSASTVNLILKKMEEDKFVIKTEKGYALGNVEFYLDRFKFLLSEYKSKHYYASYETSISDNELQEKIYSYRENSKWAVSGPRIDSIIEGGYLNNAKEFSIYIEIKSQTGLMSDLKLIPSNRGRIKLYSTDISLADNAHVAHEIIQSMDLLSHNDSRINEAGHYKLKKYLEKYKVAQFERFNIKNF